MRAPYTRWAGKRLEAAGLLFPAFYLAENLEVADSGLPPTVHYLLHGARSGLSACPLFDVDYYRAQLRLPGERRAEPLLHYHLIGRRLRLDPHPWFRTRFYLESHPDVWASRADPLGHYLRHGWKEGRAPCPDFDPAFYLRHYPDAAAAGENPLLHYLRVGRFEDRWIGHAGAAGCETEARGPEQPGTQDWAGLHCAARGAPPLVDVIVPVYGNAPLTLRCLYSVLAAAVDTAFELVVIDDAGPEEGLRGELSALAERFGFTLLRNARNQGFVRSANRGMALHPDRDVVLLNADTEVYDGWLDRLRAAARRHPRTGTVTPFSNNATICSYPLFDRDNPFPLELSYAELDALAAEVNAGRELEIPTAVGFCVYLRRDCLDAVGLFDEAAFGRGYGEENDLCMRAAAFGWRNILAGDVFVRHWGGASFGAEKRDRLKAAEKTLRRRHPSYFPTVQRFARADPPRPLRAALDQARLRRWAARGAAPLLIISHNRGGGTEQHVEAMIAEAEAAGRPVFRLRPSGDGPEKVELFLPQVRAFPNLAAFDLHADLDRLSSLLKELSVAEIQVHSLVDLIPEAPAQVLALARACGARLGFMVHDYACVCPRINLVDASGLYCGEPSDPAVCDACLAGAGSSFGAPAIRPWRARYRALLGEASVRVPDEDVRQRLLRHFPELNMVVDPHEPVAPAPPPSRPRAARGGVVTIAILGALSEIKGYHVLAACAADARERRLPLRFRLIGFSADDRRLRRLGVEVSGRYRNADVPALMAKYAPDLVWLPSVWPETYSYALSLALESGLPIAAFDLGAIAARLRRLGLDGGLMPLALARAPAALNERLLAMAKDEPCAAQGAPSPASGDEAANSAPRPAVCGAETAPALQPSAALGRGRSLAPEEAGDERARRPGRRGAGLSHITSQDL